MGSGVACAGSGGSEQQTETHGGFGFIRVRVCVVRDEIEGKREMCGCAGATPESGQWAA